MKIISIHSQKGGTGKTTLALSLALYAASAGKRPVIVDADLSGTTMRDILHFPDGVAYSTSIVDYFLEPKASPLRYLNNAELVHKETKTPYKIPILLGTDNADHSRVMSLVYKETHTQFLKHKLEKFINSIHIETSTEEKIDVVIIDNSPGSWGLSKAVLEIVTSSKLTINPHFNYTGFPLMVSSADLNDLISCIRTRLFESHVKYTHVINRSSYGDQLDSNIKTIRQNLENKAEDDGKNEGYRTYATLLGEQDYIKWVGKDDKEFTPYLDHVRTFNPIANIAKLANLFGIS